MAIKKYISYDRLVYYDKKIKAYIASAVNKILAESKSYADSLSSNFDTAGSSATVQSNLNVVEDKVDDHIADSNIHFTSAERTKLAGIADKANNYSHPNSGVTASTYKSVTVNTQGHVTGGSNPTTLAGYGITDAEAKGSVNSHNVSTSAHSDIRNLISSLTTKVNNFLDIDDTTTDQLSELIALIQENADDIETITSGKVNVSDIVNNLTTNSSNKPLSAAQGVALKALIDTLQSELDTLEGTVNTISTNLSNHTGNKSNPHGVTKGQVGLGNVPNVTTNNQTPTYTASSTLTALTSGEVLSTAFGKLSKAVSDLISHLANKSNPHSVTKAQVGLGSVDNTADSAKSVKYATTAGTLTDLTATVAELNKLDGVTATTTELNYVDGVTSNIQTQLNGKSSTSHTHSSSTITSGYLNTHPENSPTIIPFINNDIAFLDKRGGSFSYYTTTATDFTVVDIEQTAMTLTNPSNMFDGTQTYTSLPASTTYTMVIDMTLHKTFAYSSIFYIDFGSNGWRAKNIKLYVMNADTETKYTEKGSITDNAKGNWMVNVSHTSTNASGGTVQGFNRMRVVISDFANGSNRRIAQIGLINYSSAGISEVAVSRGGCAGIYGSLIPSATNSIDLGSSSRVWKNIYATTFTGALSGNASSASKLATARTISLTGAVTGSGEFDGSGNLSIATTEANSPKMYTYTVTATSDNQKTFTISLSGFSTTTDSVMFQSGRTMLLPKEDFTVSGATITLTEGVPKGRVCGIYILKNIPFGN